MKKRSSPTPVKFGVGSSEVNATPLEPGNTKASIASQGAGTYI